MVLERALEYLKAGSVHDIGALRLRLEQSTDDGMGES